MRIVGDGELRVRVEHALQQGRARAGTSHDEQERVLARRSPHCQTFRTGLDRTARSSGLACSR